MNDIIRFLELEDPSITIEDISIEGRVKTVRLSTPPKIRFCPLCGFRMHSRGIKIRKINHPILQDTYQLVLLLKEEVEFSLVEVQN